MKFKNIYLKIVFFFSVTPTCPNDLVESPWLAALGFTYMKQEPNWMTDGQILDGKYRLLFCCFLICYKKR